MNRIGRKIDYALIDSLIYLIDRSRYEKVSLSELPISQADIDDFKRFVDKEEQRVKESRNNRFSDIYYNLYAFPGQNTDFDFYRSIADSLKYLEDDVIADAFWQASGNWSTTTDWRKITLVSKDGRTLIVENSDDRPNYLHNPWIVNFEGVMFPMNSIAFGMLIDEITRGFFFEEVVRDKRYAIFKIADYLYRKKLSEN